jgi:hypothetical protein
MQLLTGVNSIFKADSAYRAKVDEVAAGGEVLTKLPATLVADSLQVLHRHRRGGDVRGDRPAQVLASVIDTDLREVSGVVAE